PKRGSEVGDPSPAAEGVLELALQQKLLPPGEPYITPRPNQAEAVARSVQFGQIPQRVPEHLRNVPGFQAGMGCLAGERGAVKRDMDQRFLQEERLAMPHDAKPERRFIAV